jgi:hypothetical protein
MNNQLDFERIFGGKGENSPVRELLMTSCLNKLSLQFFFRRVQSCKTLAIWRDKLERFTLENILSQVWILTVEL